MVGRVRLWLLPLFAFAALASLSGQVVFSTLTGTMLDPSGSAIAGGQVAAHSRETGSTAAATTNANGIYVLPNLRPGVYDVTFSAPSFSKTVMQGITLTVGENHLLNASMKIGQVNEQVEVAGAAPQIDLADATVQGVISESNIQELPLNARSWSDLADLEPGVFAIRTQPDLSIRDRANRGFGQQESISGNRPQGNNYRLDGISINDPTNGAPGSVLGGNLGVDAVAEFSVLTGNYSAEYGRANGGVLNAITKSGTNSFHGSVYEFLRNSALDARNYFDDTKPPFRRNQFGGSAGGPIQKDKTFVFGDYEGLRQVLNLSQVSIVPSANARLGILSTGNITVDPQVLKYLNAFYPIPTQPNGNSPDTGRVVFGRPQNTSENFFTGRVDHRFSDKNNLHGTYMYDFAGVNTVDEFKNKVVNTVTHRQLVTLDDGHMFNNNFFNDIRIGYHRYYEGAPSGATPINPAVSDVSLGFVPGLTSGQIAVSGLTQFSGGLAATSPILYRWNSYQLYDEASYTLGKHSIKFGGSIEYIRNNTSSEPRPGGTFGFGSLTNFLLNKPNNLSTDFAGLNPKRGIRQSIYGLYIADDIRWRPNLTVNLGLRYEPTSVPNEADGKVASLPTPSSPTARTGAPLFNNNTLKDFSPRVGFAWDPFGDGKTSVRSGFGMYDQLPYLGEMGSTISSTFPFLLTGGIPLKTHPGSFPTIAYQLAVSNGASSRIAYITQNPGRSYVMQWNLSVERQIGHDFSAFVGYLGSHGVRGITQDDDANIVLPIGKTPQGYIWPSPAGSGTRLNPSVGREPTTLFRNSAIYHGLQSRLTKNMSHGFQLKGSFSWARSIDDASGAITGDTFTNGLTSMFVFDPRLTRAPSDFNIDRNLSLTALWQMPALHTPVVGSFLGGWQMSVIFSAQDGQPFTPLMGGDPLGLNSTDPLAFPDRLANPGCGNPVNPGNVQNYINLNCFAAPSVLTRMGNAGRNSIIGPGLENLDYSLVKNTHIRSISEAFNVQFRAEFFNILNHANFAPPIDNSTLFDETGVAQPGAGSIDATTTTSRQIQFGLKVIW